MNIENIINQLELTPIKQGVQDEYIEESVINPNEYETYIDPDYGCTKTRKKIKTEDTEKAESLTSTKSKIKSKKIKS